MDLSSEGVLENSPNQSFAGRKERRDNGADVPNGWRRLLVGICQVVLRPDRPRHRKTWPLGPSVHQRKTPCFQGVKRLWPV